MSYNVHYVDDGDENNDQ